MSARADVDRLLERIRPADPVGREADEAAVRILARVAMLDAGRRAAAQRRPGLGRTAGLAAAVLLALSAPLAALRENHPIGSEATTSAAHPLAGVVAEAVAGDPLARRRVLTAGPAKRDALLAHAVRSEADGVQALELLAAAGGIRTGDQVAEVARLAERPALRAAAVDLLARSPHAAGCRALGRLLIEVPGAEPEVVAALRRAARRGRSGAAREALLEGAVQGRLIAAVAAIELGGARGLEHALAVLPDEVRRSPATVRALQEGRATTRARLLRLAETGNEAALDLAVASRLAGVVPVLARRARQAEAPAAAWAVDALACLGDDEAWRAVAAALGGPADAACRDRLRTAPPRVLDHLVRIAVGEPARRAVALEGLAAGGEGGLERLARLARRRPQLALDVVDVLATAEAPGAVRLLADLAAAAADAGPAARALGRRLSVGDEEAGAALLAVAREGKADVALRELARRLDSGSRPWLLRATRDPSLRAAAQRILRRAGRRDHGVEAATRRDAPRSRPIT
jgi:hypothetical protein